MKNASIRTWPAASVARRGGRCRHRKTLVIAALALALGAAPGLAHEGHDHGAAAKPAALPQLAPRFAAASELFEVVGVAGSDGLTLYLDRFADNRPVSGARLEVDGALKGVAGEIAPAVYRLPAATLAPGRHELTLTISAGEDSDLLATELRIEATAVAVAPAAAGIAPRQALLGGVLVLGLIGVGWQLRRRRGA